MADEKIYVKDLRIFKGVDLKNIVIVDNSVLSFAFHLENGIPILPFYDNKSDNEMNVLVNYLKTIAKKEDLRTENKKYIKLDIFNKRSLDKSAYNSEKDSSVLIDGDSSNIIGSCDVSLTSETDNTASYRSFNNSLDLSEDQSKKVRKFIEETHKSYLTMFEK